MATILAVITASISISTIAVATIAIAIAVATIPISTNIATVVIRALLLCPRLLLQISLLPCERLLLLMLPVLSSAIIITHIHRPAKLNAKAPILCLCLHRSR